MSLEPRTSDRVLVLGDGFLGELSRGIGIGEPFLGEQRLGLEIVYGFLEELKLGLVIVEYFCLLDSQLCVRVLGGIFTFPNTALPKMLT